MEEESTSVITLSRRKYLARILGLFGTLFGGSALYIISRYLFPNASETVMKTSMTIARVEDIALNTAKIVTFNGKPAYIIHTKSGQFVALSAVCTHLGCTVQFDPADGGPGGFHCNCHGGRYDLTGKNISGPPPKPLQAYRINIKDDNIIISTI